MHSQVWDGAFATPIIDGHCHAFEHAREAGSLAQQFSISEVPLPVEMLQETVLFRRVARELSRILDCPADPQALQETRDAAYAGDPKGYVEKLFTDAGFSCLLVDTGYPSTRTSGYSIDMDGFRALVPCAVQEIFRIEPLLDGLLDERRDFLDCVRSFKETLGKSLQKSSVIALKSVIAYRTGLDIRIPSARSAAAAHGRMVGGRRRIGDEKAVRDFFFEVALELAREHDRPIQVHTGVGDGPDFDLVGANPALLARLLAIPKYRAAQLVLVHAGYPYVEEAGWLTSQFQGVHVDISEMLPFAAHATREKLAALLEMAPMTKVLFGSDGVHAPEVHWFAALEGRQAVADVASRLAESGWLTTEEATRLVTLLLHDNAVRLYRLVERQ